MSAVYGSEKGFTVTEISILVGAIYVSGILFQYPVGFISDRVDRRILIIILSSFAVFGLSFGLIFSENFYVLVFVFVIAGGVANPMYSVLIAYTNDYLKSEDMSSAAGGLVFLMGSGGVISPIISGQLMNLFGPDTFISTLIFIFLAISFYGLYRATKRSILDIDSSTSHISIMPQATNVAVEISQEVAVEEAIVNDTN